MSIFTTLTKYADKILKFKYSFEPVLHNRFVLYFILFFALADLFYFTVVEDYISVMTFLLVGFLTSFFSKNMVVILFFGLILTHILRVGTNDKIREGMKSELDTENDVNNDSDKKTVTPTSTATKAATPTSTATKAATPTSTATKAATSTATTATQAAKTAALLKQSAEIKQELKDFNDLQTKILNNISELNPLLEKAETFMNKFENANNALASK